jgi:23S rRNA pseudouridine955/2504/2580 synthase
MLSYTITADDHCRRLESFLQRLLSAALPAYCRKLIKSGACRINSTAVTPDTQLASGDIINLKESGQVLGFLNSHPAPIDLLWQDDHLLVLNKPAGLATHPSAETDENLVEIASAWLEKRTNYPVRTYPVNRLDRGTSGVVLLATSSTCAGILGKQIQEEGLDKVYLAVVEGTLTGSSEINQPLEGKDSLSRYRSLATGKNHSFLLVEPLTGRTHQIRRHLSMIGHQVAGDKRYNAAPMPALSGIALHSFRTVLRHPVNDIQLTICAPLPKALRELIIERCGVEESELLNLLTEII